MFRLASLRLVDLNAKVCIKVQESLQSSLPEASGSKSVALSTCAPTATSLASLRLVDLNAQYEGNGFK